MIKYLVKGVVYDSLLVYISMLSQILNLALIFLLAVL